MYMLSCDGTNVSTWQIQICFECAQICLRGYRALFKCISMFSFSLSLFSLSHSEQTGIVIALPIRCLQIIVFMNSMFVSFTFHRRRLPFNIDTYRHRYPVYSTVLRPRKMLSTHTHHTWMASERHQRQTAVSCYPNIQASFINIKRKNAGGTNERKS